jgi:hypothetical protein
MVIAQTGRIAATTAIARDDVAARPAGSASVSASVSALVPVEHPPVSRATARHDAYFVAQLIAMAQHGTQTEVLRPAGPQVARAAYPPTNEPNRPRLLRVI